jgi:biotin operon repressor
MPETPVTKEALHARLGLGQASGKDVKTLAFEVGTTERAIRQLVEDLIETGVPVCAHPKTGYYIAATEAEVQATCQWLHGRAVHTLGKISRLRAAFAKSIGIDQIVDEEIPAL